MLFLRLCLLVLFCAVGSHGTEILRMQLDKSSFLRFDLQPEGDGINLIKVSEDGLADDIGIIGRGLGIPRIEIESGPSVHLTFSTADLKIVKRDIDQGYLLQIVWIAKPDKRMVDCFGLSSAEWYGGPQQRRQYWPIQKLNFSDYSYVTKEADSAAVTEPYWLGSNAMFLYVLKNTPLFIDQNNILDEHVCLVAEVKPPYSSRRQYNELSYVVGFTNSVRKSHEYVIKNFLGKPTGRPDYRMIEQPIWSTWAQYKRDVNETSVRDFAQQILNNKFNNSQLEIDDKWETCYGSFNVDTTRFPDLRRFNRELKSLGFRVTVWVHPFINKDCEPWYTEAKNNGYLVKNETGDLDTQWWNSEARMAAYVDFTNPKALSWWVGRLRNLSETYEIDSFKFDAGETSWSPQIPIQTGDIVDHPSKITIDYVKACATFGPLVEVRTAQRTQDLPIFVRMIDKDTEWDFNNGLPTLITTLLQMNLNGYPFVLPDMIGGNGYNEKPSKELFIRWLQANTFMPSMQYSYVPWDYDNETIAISHIYTDLHAAFSPYISLLFNQAVVTGNPVNMPIWWIDPDDKEAAKIWDEFLLGEQILVAPVVEKGATSRNIYLPRGQWIVEGNVNNTVDGPVWLNGYSAPLHVLPYFIRVPENRTDFEALGIPIDLPY